jgi:hypothetical protein
VTEPSAHALVDVRAWRASGGLADCIAEEPGPDDGGPQLATALPFGDRELISFGPTGATRLRFSPGPELREEPALSDISIVSDETEQWLAGSVLDSVAIGDPGRPIVRIVFDLRARSGRRLCEDPLSERLALLAELARDRRWPSWWGVGPSGRGRDAELLGDRLSLATGTGSRLMVRRLAARERELGRDFEGQRFVFAAAVR